MGVAVAFTVGLTAVFTVGVAVAFTVGLTAVFTVGVAVAFTVGLTTVFTVGVAVAFTVGLTAAFTVGVTVGVTLGVGVAVGVTVGVVDVHATLSVFQLPPLLKSTIELYCRYTKKPPLSQAVLADPLTPFPEAVFPKFAGPAASLYHDPVPPRAPPLSSQCV